MGDGKELYSSLSEGIGTSRRYKYPVVVAVTMGRFN